MPVSDFRVQTCPQDSHEENRARRSSEEQSVSAERCTSLIFECKVKKKKRKTRQEIRGKIMAEGEKHRFLG